MRPNLSATKLLFKSEAASCLEDKSPAVRKSTGQVGYIKDGGSREELGEGAAAHVLSHDAHDGGVFRRGHNGAVEAQHVGVVQAGQHVRLTPERHAVRRHLPRLHMHP